MLQVEYVVGTDGQDALSNGLIVVAAEPQAVVRDLMEAVRKLVNHSFLPLTQS